MPASKTMTIDSKWEYILVIIAGIIVMLPLSFPEYYYLSWIGLVPLLFSLSVSGMDKPLIAFIKGWLMGIIIFAGTSFWLYFPIVHFSGFSNLLSLLLLLLLFVLAGIFYGFWSWVFTLIRGENISVIWLSLSWTGVEYLRYRLLSGLPFAFIGYTQVNFKSLLQLVDLGGVFFIGFIVLMINGYIFKLFRRRKLRYLIPIVGLILLVVLSGNVKLHNIQNKKYSSLKVGIVQTFLSPTEKWKIANIESNLDYLLEHSKQLSDVKLIIWPETSLTFDLIRNEYYRKKFIAGLKKIDSHLQVGSLAIIDDNHQRYNSSFLIAPDGKIKARYNKNRLVPFGEYLPYATLVENLTGFTLFSEQPGKEISIFTISPVSWKTAICSEILFPELVKKKVSEANFIVNQSNESWYLKGNLQTQMWTAAIFRAVENRRSVVKAGNLAYSGIILPTGTVLIKNNPKEDDLISGKVWLNQTQTLYQAWGDYSGYISLGVILLVLLINLILYLRKQK